MEPLKRFLEDRKHEVGEMTDEISKTKKKEKELSASASGAAVEAAATTSPDATGSRLSTKASNKSEYKSLQVDPPRHPK